MSIDDFGQYQKDAETDGVANSPKTVPKTVPGVIKLDTEKATPRTGNSTVAELFRRQGRKVFHLLNRKLRNKEDAQDATQEVFLRLWRQESRGRLNEQAGGYMHVAANTVAIDAERRRRSHGYGLHDNLEEQELLLKQAGNDESRHWREGVELLLWSLQQLADTTQQVFILYHFDGLSHADIARKLDLSIRSVERHMARALAHCKQQLGSYL